MESRAKHPIFNLLIVNHDARFREECHEAVFNSEFNGRGAAVVRTARAPQIQSGTVSLELPNVLNDARHRNPGCTGGSHQRVIDVHVNNHIVADHAEFAVGLSNIFRYLPVRPGLNNPFADSVAHLRSIAEEERSCR
jgi:hypothetical protein